MKRLIDESFEVAEPESLAWDHLAQVENWPTWAKRIKSVVRTPPSFCSNPNYLFISRSCDFAKSLTNSDQ